MRVSDIVYRRDAVIKKIPSSALKDVRLHQISLFPVELQMEFKDRKDGMIGRFSDDDSCFGVERCGIYL